MVIGEGVIGGGAPKLKDVVSAVRQELQARELKEKEKNKKQEAVIKPKEQGMMFVFY